MRTTTRDRLQKVLIIHQSRDARDDLAVRLRGYFDVCKVKDCETGWQTIVVDPTVRVVLASLPMIELDGFGLLQHVRGSRVPRILRMPIAILTDTDGNLIDELALSFGASEVIPLETEAVELRSRLTALMDPSAPRRPPKQPKEQPQQQPKAALLAQMSVVSASEVNGSLPEKSSASAIHDQPNPVRFEPENTMARFDNLNKVLKTLQNSSPGVEASALISSDGLMIASALTQDFDEARVAGMTATLLNLGTRAATELRRGEVGEVVVRGEHGYAVVISAGRGALLLVLATETTPLGLIFFDMREAVKAIKTIL
jgi:predicted regulator of Ras-like GTPase activity (Roadblock/LC7/MglB family)/DNA-binding response OmpR family regulator